MTWGRIELNWQPSIKNIEKDNVDNDDDDGDDNAAVADDDDDSDDDDDNTIILIETLTKHDTIIISSSHPNWEKKIPEIRLLVPEIEKRIKSLIPCTAVASNGYENERYYER